MSLSINHNLMAINTTRNLSSHYSNMGTSIRRLSSGLRVGTAADDAAGLAVRELMRSDISSINQGIRNANDAISMIQTADGALSIIDEKLIRMKELAIQASTGTYNSDQRIMINSEFQAMALEIQRISESTEFNGIKLLNGNLSGEHDGTGLNSTGSAKIHFGTGNDCAEDYYYLNIGDASLEGLNLGNTIPSNIQRLNERVSNGAIETHQISGVVPFAYIPKGSTNVIIRINSYAEFQDIDSFDDDIQLFTRDGTHLVGTSIKSTYVAGDANSNDLVWHENSIDLSNVNSNFITTENGFYNYATYDSSYLNSGSGYSGSSGTQATKYNGMTIEYGADGDHYDSNVNEDKVDVGYGYEYATISETTEDLLLFVVGYEQFSCSVSWDSMSESNYSTVDGVQPLDISTQEDAQSALNMIDQAIIKKDEIRANLGATQNRLENTVTNLSIQSENLQAAESQISDTDYATETTALAKEQILAQAATAMLAQANSLSKIALEIIEG